ncbi:MAG: SMC family ATPase, partial [Armatimonadetes bacterium]|nr:SMC family ATPase [Armatimonadota bacterium]
GQALDLSGLHVVCLCGDNGHGKSALLDAITWALWGAARGQLAGTRSLRTEELVYTGETDMEVALEFLADETRYRVVRKYSRRPHGPGSGGSLDLQVATGASPPAESAGHWRSISESSASTTQDKINRVLRMDYATFVNTAFLLQGKADLFMRADPAQRKQVLADILDLGLYDRLAERGRQLASEAGAELAQVEAETRRLEVEVATRPDAEAAAVVAREALDAGAAQIAEADRRLDAARARLADLEAASREAQRVQQFIESHRWSILADEQRLERLEARRAAYEQAIAGRDAVLAKEAALLDTRRRLGELEALAGRHYELQGFAAQQQRAVEVARTRLEQEAVNTERRLTELLARADAHDAHQPALNEARAQLAALDVESARLLERQSASQALRDQAQHLEADMKALTTELEKLRAQLRMVASETGPVCPVCKTPLGPEGRAHLEQEILEQGRAMRARHDQGQANLAETRVQAGALAAQLERDDAAQRVRREDALRRQERATRSLEDAAAARQEAASCRAALDALRARLALGGYAEQDQAALRRVQEEQAALGYDPAIHQQVRGNAAVLEPVAEAARSLRDAEQRLPEVLEESASVRRLIGQARAALDGAERDAGRLAAALQSQSAVTSQFATLARDRDDLQRRHRESQEAVARADARLADLAERQIRLRALEQTARRSMESRETYVHLAEAFGRNGLQALIIEEAVPALEADANELLARLSDGRMALKVETQRPTRRGAPVDTLDLRVSDELGTRSYDLFSGGEAFRVNFALRVALAQLLSRRAGAPLRTLFVDEGFGTQDASGRERLV